MVTDMGTRAWNGLWIEWELDTDPGDRESPPWEDYKMTASIGDLEEIEASFIEKEVVDMLSKYSPHYDELSGKWLYSRAPDSGDIIELPDSVRESFLETLR